MQVAIAKKIIHNSNIEIFLNPDHIISVKREDSGNLSIKMSNDKTIITESLVFEELNPTEFKSIK